MLAVVALRKESVDRNIFKRRSNGCHHYVALRKESVDRNHVARPRQAGIRKSLSARRAWIEMSPLMWPWSPLNVALRKESVDRNCAGLVAGSKHIVALRKESVDRNPKWRRGLFCWRSVALRKESVDRNQPSKQCVEIAKRRSPQGERG